MHSSDKDTIDLASIFFYLSEGSRIQLTSVDAQVHPTNEGEVIRSRETAIALDEGRLLVLRGGGWRTIHVIFEGGAASIVGSGRAIMAVELSVRVIILDCLQGNCTLAEEGHGAMSKSLVVCPVETHGKPILFRSIFDVS